MTNETEPTADTEKRFHAALRKFHQLEADALAGFGAQRALSDAMREAAAAVLAAEERVTFIRNHPGGHGSRFNRLMATRQYHRAVLELNEAKAWQEAITEACAANEPECQRRGRLRDDCAEVIQRMRQELHLEVANNAQA